MIVHRRFARRLALAPAFFCAFFIHSLWAPAQTRQTIEPDNSSHALALSTELISLTVAVTDARGRHVSGLSKSSFSVFDDQVEQEISFFSNTDTPASIGFVFDVSGSMRDEKIARAREAIKRFVKTSHSQDEYSLICFNQNTRLLMDQTQDIDAVMNRLIDVHPKGSTALYDAIAAGIKHVSQGVHSKRALIVISDGEDNHSRISFDRLKRNLKESDVLVYTILIGPLKQLSNGGVIMDIMASITGGYGFFPSSTDKMDEAFDRIALELRQHYSIGYTPSNFTADGKWRRITVRVTPPPGLGKVVVRTRQGYFATARRDGTLGGSDE
jgi:Ca-activated chloride channel family protein